MSQQLTTSTTIQPMLERLEIGQPGWQTLIVSATADTDLPRSAIWKKWSDLENWPTWSPIHTSTRWISQPEWEVGAQFEQTLNLGFPLGQTVATEIVGEAIFGERVGWWKDEKGIRSYHVWSFEDRPGGGTRVTNTEIFHGTAVSLIKPLVGGRWQRMFAAAVNSLIKQVRG